MSVVIINPRALAHAKALIEKRDFVLDERGDWSKHQPLPKDENHFIAVHGFPEYELWHLGVDEAEPKDTKKRYKFPYGNFKRVHRCAVLAAESRAGQYDYEDIELAAAHLHGMLEGMRVLI